MNKAGLVAPVSHIQIHLRRLRRGDRPPAGFSGSFDTAGEGFVNELGA